MCRHRQAQGVQADEAWPGLLARRFEERDVAADLRHGMGEEEDLDAYLFRLEEAEKRDHRPPRQAARSVFTCRHEAPGMVFWHPKAGRCGR